MAILNRITYLWGVHRFCAPPATPHRYPLSKWSKKLLITDKGNWVNSNGHRQLKQPILNAVQAGMDDSPPAGCQWTANWTSGEWECKERYSTHFVCLLCPLSLGLFTISSL